MQRVLFIFVLTIVATATSLVTGPSGLNDWWTLTNNMDAPSARSFAASSSMPLLSTGGDSIPFFMVFGGWNGYSESYNDTWRFSPDSNTWEYLVLDAGQSPPPGRYSSSLTRLIGNQVESVGVLFGGRDSETVFQDTWLYSTFGNTWTPHHTSGYAPSPRFAHAAATFSDSVLVLFGGQRNLSLPVTVCNETWLFDSRTLAWSPANVTSRPQARAYHAMASSFLFGQSRVFLFGGRNEKLTLFDDLWVFEQSRSGQYDWRLLADACTGTIGRMSASFTQVGPLEIILYGGVGSGNSFEANEMLSYNIDNGNWTVLTPQGAQPSQRAGQSAALLTPTPNSSKYANSLFVFGGASVSGQIFSTVWLWSSPNTLWTDLSTVDTAPAGRIASASAFVQSSSSNLFIVQGGLSIFFQEYNVHSDLWQFDLALSQWTRISNPRTIGPSARYCHTGELMSYTSGTNTYTAFTIFGGLHPTHQFNAETWTIQILDSSFQTWTQINTKVHPLARAGQCSTTYVAQRGTSVTENMVIFSGSNETTLFDDLWSFSLIDNTPGEAVVYNWTLLHPGGTLDSPPGRCGASLVAYDYTLILYGGSVECLWNAETTAQPAPIFRDVYVFHLALGSWNKWDTEPKSAGYARPPLSTYHTASMAGSNMIVYGGIGPDNVPLTEIHLLNALSGQWTLVPCTNTPYSTFAANTIWTETQGLVVFGGAQQGILASNLVREVIVACPPGQYGAPFSLTECTPCPLGYYSTESGVEKCASCPGLTYTMSLGSTSDDDCTVCEPSACHNKGSCVVKDYNAVCSCNAGYLASDNCRAPWIFIGVALAIAVIVVVVVVIVRLRRRADRYTTRASAYSRLLVESRADVAALERAFLIDYRDVRFKKLLASGASGDVYEGDWGDFVVAIKQLKIEVAESDQTAVSEFEKEIRYLRTLRHRNIVLFLGAGRHPDTRLPFLVSELMERGSLHTLLAESFESLPYERRIRFALDAAQGMLFLHSLRPPCLHRDLKTPNLLVSRKWTCKVADFGTSRILHTFSSDAGGDGRRTYSVNARLCEAAHSSVLSREGQILTTGLGTLLWQAPEVISGGVHGIGSDVYSFAMVLFEIATGKLPFAELREIYEIEQAVVSGKRPMIGGEVGQETREIIEACWRQSADERPSFLQVVRQLAALGETTSVDSDVEDVHTPVARRSVAFTLPTELREVSADL